MTPMISLAAFAPSQFRPCRKRCYATWQLAKKGSYESPQALMRIGGKQFLSELKFRPHKYRRTMSSSRPN